jgi:Na+/melibiose symporter-like transporter
MIIFFVVPLLLVGWLLYGMASMRDSVKPRWCRYLPFVMCATILLVIVDIAMAIVQVSLPFPLHSGLCSSIIAGFVWVAYGYVLIGASQNTTRRAV